MPASPMETNPLESLPYSLRSVLVTVVSADVVRHTVTHKQVAESLQEILAGQLSRYVDEPLSGRPSPAGALLSGDRCTATVLE